MPRKPIGHRAKKWEIKTHPDLSSEALASRHPVSSAEIKRAYDALDRVTQQVARILDKYGVMANFRIIYRAYAEELWRLTTTFTGATLGTSANAVSVKYQGYGSDTEILTDIAKLFGLSVSFVAGGVGTHNLLSAIHPDTLVGSPVAGDLIYANATPKWARLAKGSDGIPLVMSSGFPSWKDAVDHLIFTGEFPDTYSPPCIVIYKNGIYLCDSSESKYFDAAMLSNEVDVALGAGNAYILMYSKIQAGLGDFSYITMYSEELSVPAIIKLIARSDASSIELGGYSTEGGDINVFRDNSGNRQMNLDADASGSGTTKTGLLIYADVEVDRQGSGFVLKSPNGTKYRIKVANDGTLSTEAY